MSGPTEADKRRFRIMGITKAARAPEFQGGARKETSGNFSEHGCWFCGKAFPCEMEQCTHAVFTRIGLCCKPVETAGWKR